MTVFGNDKRENGLINRNMCRVDYYKHMVTFSTTFIVTRVTRATVTSVTQLTFY